MVASPTPRVTIARIAEDAGVSLPTVSKVLNGRADVSAETRARVEATIRRHGYRRRKPKQPQSVPMIDLVFHEIESPWAVELIRGVEGEASRHRTEVIISECGGTRRPRRAWIESVIARKPLGVVIVFSDLDADQRAQLAARNIPCVVVDPIGECAETGPSVGSAHFLGGRLAAQHLIVLGHTRIGVISGPMETLAARMRLAGFRDALAEAGLALPDAYVRHGTFKIEAGETHGSELLALRERPTAIFASSDLQAMGVYRAAHALGLAVPGDVSVVGYDDLPIAEWVFPPLTTVHQPLREMAEAATRLVLQLSRGEQAPAPSLELAVRFVQRASTAPPAEPTAGTPVP
ncbi:LacI family DNA-binding transcriptional regulator [Propioniciclava soli]|uniref:LacI family DNA-binding transcriptional regulator n=1 Tax=Propioniciclava soli TaxID=2775081 RepID=A0ABZ3C7M2_9ACTN